jgi:hypothetical protein
MGFELGAGMSRGTRARKQLGLALALLCALALPAHSEVRLESDASGIRLTATNAPLSEVLAALKAKFPLRYGAVAVEREINGTIEGTLHRVVVRLLDGFDFVVSRSPEGVEIVKLAPRGTASFTPPARRGVTEWKIPAAQAAAPAAAQPPR